VPGGRLVEPLQQLQHQVTHRCRFGDAMRDVRSHTRITIMGNGFGENGLIQPVSRRGNPQGVGSPAMCLTICCRTASSNVHLGQEYGTGARLWSSRSGIRGLRRSHDLAQTAM
jgi:hypothetical protein